MSWAARKSTKAATTMARPMGCSVNEPIRPRAPGLGRIEVRPTQTAITTSLNVIQFGECHTLTSMSPVVSVNSSEGRHIGAHIKDVGNPWILVFAKTLPIYRLVRPLTIRSIRPVRIQAFIDEYETFFELLCQTITGKR
jgi:hypothetical protein